MSAMFIGIHLDQFWDHVHSLKAKFDKSFNEVKPKNVQ